MKETSVKRFEIYNYNFGKNPGHIQSGFRPVLVIQDNRMNQNSPTTIVAAITTAVKKTYLPSHVIIGPEYGLDNSSMVMMEQLHVVNQDELTRYVGTVTDERMQRRLTDAAKKALGFWTYEPKDKTTIRCLCPRCLNDYKETGAYIIRRIDPFQKEKEHCDRCNYLGWDYVVIDRKSNCSKKPNDSN
jgi:mRNA interferase MazF